MVACNGLVFTNGSGSKFFLEGGELEFNIVRYDHLIQFEQIKKKVMDLKNVSKLKNIW